MSNVIRFPAGRPVSAERIPREQFQRRAGLALDVVDQILVLLDDEDGRQPATELWISGRPLEVDRDG